MADGRRAPSTVAPGSPRPGLNQGVLCGGNVNFNFCCHGAYL